MVEAPQPLEFALSDDSGTASLTNAAALVELERASMEVDSDAASCLGSLSDSEDESWDGSQSLDLSFTSTETAATSESVATTTDAAVPTDFAHLYPKGAPDEYLYCEACADWVRDACIDHPPEFRDDDDDRELAAPTCLRLTGDGVVATTDIPAGTLFGPYQGPTQRDYPAAPVARLAYSWEVKTYNGWSTYFIAEESGSESHWTARVGRAETESEQNLVAVQFRGDVYFKTRRPLAPGDVLRVYAGEGLPVARAQGGAERAPDVGGALECGLCPGSHFASYSQRAEHLRGPRHRPADDLRCRDCGFVARSRRGLRSHVVTAHQEQPFRCAFCPRTFPRGDRLESHVAKRHSGGAKVPKTHACDKCGKSFYKRHHLKRHQAVHSGKVFPCQKCDRELRSEETLRLHLESVHSDGHRPYACAECPKTFATSVYLQRHHFKVHRKPKTQPKPAAPKPGQSKSTACRWCPETLATVGSRVRHEQRKHRDEFDAAAKVADVAGDKGAFQCQLCPASFLLPNRLKYHMIRHSGNFPATCKICGKGYVTQSELRKHTKRSHAETTTAPEADWKDIEEDLRAELVDEVM